MLCRWHPVLERTLTIQPYNWTDDMHNLYSGAPYPPGARTNVKRCESVFYVFDAVQRVSSVQLATSVSRLFIRL
nr:MAG TPA: hypothetical protein [Caudoviricetes sp.]